MHLLIDSTSIRGEGEGEWSVRIHGGQICHVWRNFDIGVVEQMLEVGRLKSPEATLEHAPMLPELLDEIPAD